MTSIRHLGLFVGAAFALAVLALAPQSARAFTSEDGTFDFSGYVDNNTFWRAGQGLNKERITLQTEFNKRTGGFGPVEMLNLRVIMRGSYDGAYDLNSGRYGNDAGGQAFMPNFGIPGQPFTPWGQSPVSTGTNLGFGVMGFGFDTTRNPNDGLAIVGSNLHGSFPNEITFAGPQRPCDKDSRGCISGYMDATMKELRCWECNDRLDFFREAYVDAAVPFSSGSTLNFRLGKQQVVWGRTDLFRVLDVVNPVNFSRNNIYDELQDIRMPQWILNSEYRMGPTGIFDDLNIGLMWNFDKFRPDDLGQRGTPYQILQAGDLFAALNNCFQLGCTVGNFANASTTGGIATDFPANTIGIRKAIMPKWSIENSQIGGRLEGVYKGVGFSFNYLNYLSGLPSLVHNFGTVNPFFAGAGTAGLTGPATGFFPFVPAFDIRFPRINLFGASADIYADAIKTVFRLEFAYTKGEEFPNGAKETLFSKNDVMRMVIGIDRPTFIPFLNPNRTFLISFQTFGQHIMDHELRDCDFPGKCLGKVGMPDYESNVINTFLFQGFFMNDRLVPNIIFARDWRADANTISPGAEWLVTDNWSVSARGNFKFGSRNHCFADGRDTQGIPLLQNVGANGTNGQGPLGLCSIEPLGRFRSGPLGMANQENELQFVARYRW